MNRSKILSLAHQIRRATKLNWSDCQKKAWYVYRLNEKMESGTASFQFIKADGTVRAANGTKNANLFEYEHKGSERNSNPMQVKYFDLDANAWRSFNAERLI